MIVPAWIVTEEHVAYWARSRSSYVEPNSHPSNEEEWDWLDVGDVVVPLAWRNHHVVFTFGKNWECCISFVAGKGVVVVWKQVSKKWPELER